MKYDELSELIDAWVTNHLESVKTDAMDIKYRAFAKAGLLNSILIGMSDEDRQSLADRHGWRKNKEVVLTNDNGEDSI